MKTLLNLPSEFYDSLAAQLGINTPAGITFLQIALENAKLMDNKNKDYGPRNISAFGTFGVVVKMNDKFERLKHMFSKKRRRPVNESILDSFRDIGNYAIIALMVETKRWPNE